MKIKANCYHGCRYILFQFLRVDYCSSGSYLGGDDFFLYFFCSGKDLEFVHVQIIFSLFEFWFRFNFVRFFCWKEGKLHYRRGKVTRSQKTWSTSSLKMMLIFKFSYLLIQISQNGFIIKKLSIKSAICSTSSKIQSALRVSIFFLIRKFRFFRKRNRQYFFLFTGVHGLFFNRPLAMFSINRYVWLEGCLLVLYWLSCLPIGSFSVRIVISW